MIQLPPSPTQDPWSSFDDDDGSPALASHAGPSRSPSAVSPKGQHQHPLYNSDLMGHDFPQANGAGRNGGVDVLSDVSRPALKRLTSETERQVAESSRSGSERGSLDLLRMSAADPGAEEVEVLIHHVSPLCVRGGRELNLQVKHGESIAGIALLYGIDVSLTPSPFRLSAISFASVLILTQVATLRKINKLWASDPVHLRTHLYVPLEACRWTKARDTFSRGPGDGQVTLTPKGKGKGKGKEPAQERSTSTGSLIDLETPPAVQRTGDEFDAWEDSAKEFMPSTNLSYGRASVDTTRPSLDEDRRQDTDDPVDAPRVLDIVRIPRSQLQFFPKHRPPDSRSSFESPLRPIPNRSVPRSDGPSIQNDLSTLPLPLQPRVPPQPKPSANKFVRLRPPTGPPSNAYVQQNANIIANRISSLFTVPPPPDAGLFADRRTSSSSLSFSRPSSGASTPMRNSVHVDVPLELRPRSSLDGPPARRNGHFRSASASKKYD